MVQRLTINLPMVTTQLLATEVNLPINRETGGLGEPKTDPAMQQPQEKFKEMVPKEHLLPHSLRSWENRSHS